jgi:hypothetical protein
MRQVIVSAVVVVACGVTASAQWPRFEERGVPRDAEGNVRMDAPPPRTPDGRPDLSGDWSRADPEPLPPEIAALFADPDPDAGPPVGLEPETPPFPPDPDSPPVATFFNLGANVPGNPPFRPAAAKLRADRMATDSKDNPDANCMPMGFTQFHMQPQPRKIIQTPGLITILYEANYGLRYIYTDGRELPPQGEPQPWWYGYSVGRWEGDELVVTTNNLRGADMGPFDGWLDVNGAPYSSQAVFTERFRRPIYGKLEIDVTVDDPESYTAPFTVRINQRVLVDEEPIEFVCNENQLFRERIKID